MLLLSDRISRSVRFLLVLAAFFAFVSAVPALTQTLGSIEYVEGDVAITRGGNILGDVNIGDSVENYDFIRTGAASYVVISLDGSVGMAGTITVKPKSACALDVAVSSTKQETTANLVAGAVSLKVKRLAGTPALTVRSSSTAMGVRGTTFDVVGSVTGSLLVACSEGRVSCVTEDGDEEFAIPGNAVERTAGERLRSVPVAVSDLATFRDRWETDQVSVFTDNPMAFLRQNIKAYERMLQDFRKAFAPLARDETLAQWLKNRRDGVTPSTRMDPSLLRAKGRIAKELMAVRGSLFLFEPVYYRLIEAKDYLSSENLHAMVDEGRSVDSFYRDLAASGPQLEKQVSMYRLALSLFDEYGSASNAFGDDGDDFFGDLFD